MRIAGGRQDAARRNDRPREAAATLRDQIVDQKNLHALETAAVPIENLQKDSDPAPVPGSSAS